MNISETLAASATANAFNEVLPPSSARAFTRIGSPTTASTSSENARFSRASSPNSITSSSCSRSGAPAGSPSRASLRSVSARASPSTSKSWPRNEYSPPSLIRSSRSSASSAIRSVSAPLARCT